MESCEKHPHELGVALCARCGGSWCAHCLVQVRGPRKAPYCIECAMFVGGVRSSATRPALSRRQMKARVKEVAGIAAARSEGQTYAIQSLPRSSDADLCLYKNTNLTYTK